MFYPTSSKNIVEIFLKNIFKRIHINPKLFLSVVGIGLNFLVKYFHVILSCFLCNSR